MKKRTIVVLFGILLSLMAFLGCSKKSENKEEAVKKDDKIKVGLIVSTLSNPFFVDMKNGIEEEAAKQGIELIILDSQNDPAKELANMENLITQNPQVILINPTDSAAVVNAIRMANEKNIPVVTLDRGAESGNVAAHVASDNIAGGKMAGEYIIKKLGNVGKVVELEGIAGTSAARDRGQGFNDALKSSNLKVVAKQVADFDRIKGLSVMENILQAQPEINAVFAHNDEMALGALKAIEASKKDIIVVGFDATSDAVTMVKSGKMAATVAQQPKLIGGIGIKTAVSIIKGEKIEKFIPVPLELITNE
ncbi:MAG: ribose ABC transporter substrate-binding protein RbsB [Fusobacteriaceae bacterium]|nr:ribose ABC transporter substrate-binding protein RbsB [Fusobacteriaceae bacterium]